MYRETTIALFVFLLATGTALAGGETGVTGFVDASFSGNLESRVSTFGLDQMEIDIVHEINTNGSVRADIEWVKDGDGWAQDLEQGYLAYSPEFVPNWTLTFGKFNAPIGFELLDPPDMFQFSHSLVFDYGLPTNLTGMMASSDLGARLDVAAYMVNGWDDNNRPDDGFKTFGTRLGCSFGEMGGIGLSAITGREFAESGNGGGDLFERTVVDVDLTLTPAEGWTLGGEFNTGEIVLEGLKTSWTGFLVMAHYDVNGWFGLTGRFDSFDDRDGAVFDEATPQTRTSLTFAPTFVLGDGMGALLELRTDFSDEDVFTDSDGEAAGSTTSAAFEMTFTF